MLPGSTALAHRLGCGCYLSVDPSVTPPVIEQVGKRVPRSRPFRDGHPADASEFVVVNRQATILPIVHDQQHVRAVLDRAQVAGVGEIVRDIEWHPGGGSHAAYRLTT